MKTHATSKKQVAGSTFQAKAKNQTNDASILQAYKNRTVQLAEEEEPTQFKENKTGLPDNLKSGVESLSGHSLDDVKVHYNSSEPASLQAHAYAQGTDIHVAPGQEKHLPHEAWHVVQQKEGRVQPTRQMKGKININDDAGLEKEADVMGAKALYLTSKTSQLACKECADEENKVSQLYSKSAPIQLYKNCSESDHHSNMAEKVIVKSYKERFTDNSVGEMSLKNGKSWAFADLVDLDNKEIYEIKTKKTGAAKATEEAEFYLELLNKNCVGKWKLGSAFSKKKHDLGYYGSLTYKSPGNGAIIYSADHEE